MTRSMEVGPGKFLIDEVKCLPNLLNKGPKNRCEELMETERI